MTRCFTFCIALFVPCLALAQDDANKDVSKTAKKYADFWKPFYGTWKMELKSGENAETVIWHGQMGASGQYYATRSEVDGRVVRNALHGYDPAEKCWRVVDFGITDSGDYRIRTSRVFVDIEKSGTVHNGVELRTEDEIRQSDGTVVKASGTIVIDRIGAKEIRYQVVDRTSNGEDLPKMEVKMTRLAEN